MVHCLLRSDSINTVWLQLKLASHVLGILLLHSLGRQSDRCMKALAALTAEWE